MRQASQVRYSSEPFVWHTICLYVLAGLEATYAFPARGIFMSKSTAVSQQGNTQKIEPDQWTTFLAKFTRDYRGAHARLEVIGSEVGYNVETENKPFDGVSADLKDGEHAVWITFGSTPADHLTHGIPDVTAIWVRQPMGQAGPALEVEGRDGTRTVLELSRPEAFALPPRE